MYGGSYRGYNVWRLIQRVQCMETHIEGTMNRDSYMGTRYGDSYRRYNVWSIISRVQCKETHIEGTMFGDSYRGYNVWRLI